MANSSVSWHSLLGWVAAGPSGAERLSEQTWPRARLPRQRLGQALIGHALDEHGTDAIPPHLGGQPGEMAGGGLGDRTHALDGAELDAVAVAVVAERVVAGDDPAGIAAIASSISRSAASMRAASSVARARLDVVRVAADLARHVGQDGGGRDDQGGASSGQ